MKIKVKLLLALFYVITKAIRSRHPQTSSTPSYPPPVGDPVPIDSEIWILFASGVLLGLFFI